MDGQTWYVRFVTFWYYKFRVRVWVQDLESILLPIISGNLIKPQTEFLYEDEAQKDWWSMNWINGVVVVTWLWRNLTIICINSFMHHNPCTYTRMQHWCLGHVHAWYLDAKLSPTTTRSKCRQVVIPWAGEPPHRIWISALLLLTLQEAPALGRNPYTWISYIPPVA